MPVLINQRRCILTGCNSYTAAARGWPTADHTAPGVVAYCPQHAHRLSLQGHVSAPVPAGIELRGYRLAAMRWLKRNTDLPRVKLLRQACTKLLWQSGPAESNFRLRGRPDQEKAYAAFARVGEKVERPEALAATYLGLVAWLRSDAARDQPTTRRWLDTQTGRLVHRWSAKSSKIWTVELRPTREELARDPYLKPKVVKRLDRATLTRLGQTRTIIGSILRKACEMVEEAHLEDIIRFYQEHPKLACRVARRLQK